MKIEYNEGQYFNLVDDFINVLTNIRNEINKLKESEGEWRSDAEVFRKGMNQYKSLVENIPHKVCIKDKNLAYIFCNNNFASAVKINPDDVAGKTDSDFFPEEIAIKNKSDNQGVMDKGTVEEVEDKYVLEDKVIYLKKIMVPLKTEKGEIVGILEIIGENKEKPLEEAVEEQAIRNAKLEETLKTSRKSYEYVLNNVPISILITIGGRIQFINLKWVEILGYPKEELISRPLKEFLHSEYQDDGESNNGNLGESYDQLEGKALAFVSKEGTIRWITCTKVEIIWEGESAIALYGTDITTQRKKEEDLKNSINQLRLITNSMIGSLDGNIGGAQFPPTHLQSMQ